MTYHNPLLDSLIREWHMFCSATDQLGQSAMTVAEQVELMRTGLLRASWHQARAFVCVTTADVRDAIWNDWIARLVAGVTFSMETDK